MGDTLTLIDLSNPPSFGLLWCSNRSKKLKNGPKEAEVNQELYKPSFSTISKLMEAQEFKQMMEHVDWMDFSSYDLNKVHVFINQL
ncbi:hypothetical protein I3760_03G186000 [Carya illinoinensis]|nr:hypothetical protein I3760_03G186000 [Carya illinoinensis]